MLDFFPIEFQNKEEHVFYKISKEKKSGANDEQTKNVPDSGT